MIWLILACTGPTYDSASRLDTIEAYEEFLKADPDSAYKAPAEKRLEELYFERAEEQGTLAAYEAYMDRFPDGGPHYPQVLKKASAMAFSAALASGVPAIEAYLEKYGKGDKVLGDRARGVVEAARYGKITVSEPRVEAVNLGEDPEGPKNGWGVSADVKNEGDAELAYVRLSVLWTDAAGKEIGTRDYPLTAERWAMPASELEQTPMKPGEQRTWKWTEDYKDIPADAAPAAKVYVSGLRAKGASE